MLQKIPICKLDAVKIPKLEMHRVAVPWMYVWGICWVRVPASSAHGAALALWLKSWSHFRNPGRKWSDKQTITGLWAHTITRSRGTAKHRMLLISRRYSNDGWRQSIDSRSTIVLTVVNPRYDREVFEKVNMSKSQWILGVYEWSLLITWTATKPTTGRNLDDKISNHKFGK